MRRLLAILLLSATSYGLVAPVKFSRAMAQVPPCCRNNGKHKCLMRSSSGAEAISGQAIATVSDTCPFSNRAGALGAGPHAFPAPAARSYSGVSLQASAAIARAHAGIEAGFTRIPPERGPPFLLA